MRLDLADQTNSKTDDALSIRQIDEYHSEAFVEGFREADLELQPKTKRVWSGPHGERLYQHCQRDYERGLQNARAFRKGHTDIDGCEHGG